ncbi:hypothetical protein HDU76_004763 [Blyttiomyces sp. JEL0837]|nr:hypothetical protein HDU76_004763 [Blyttiomyces sp. JEL0837]
MVNFGTSLLVGLASVAASVASVQATEIIYLVTSLYSSHGFGGGDYNRYEAWYYGDANKSCVGCNALPDAVGIIQGVNANVGTFNPYAQSFTATFPDGNYANFNLYQPENYAFAPAGYTTTMYKTFNCNIDNGRTLWDCGVGGGSTCYAKAQFYCLPA